MARILALAVIPAAVATVAFADDGNDGGYGIANFPQYGAPVHAAGQSQTNGSGVIISAATSIEGCNAGLAQFEGAYVCSDRLPVGVVVVPFNGGLFAYTQQYLQSLRASSGSSSGTASENHSWAAPGMTGGWDSGFNALGQSDSTNPGSEGAGTSTTGGEGGSSSGGEDGGSP